MLTGIIFDWAGTCASEGEPLCAPILSSKTGLNLTQLNEKTEDLYNAYAVGNITTEDFWQQVLMRFGLQDDKDITIEEVSKAYLASSIVWPEMLQTAAHCKAKGLQVGLLSNSTVFMRDHLLHSIPIADYFNPAVFSCDEDVASLKPDAKPYEITLSKMKTQPEETLFIDNSGINIEAAKKIGLQTLHFQSIEQFAEDLQMRYTELYV